MQVGVESNSLDKWYDRVNGKENLNVWSVKIGHLLEIFKQVIQEGHDSLNQFLPMVHFLALL